MAFSIRSFFGKEKATDPMAQGNGSPENQGGALPPLGANPFQSAPAHPFAASPTSKAADPTSAPMNSPFTPFTPADPGRTELTVGDILPGLPPEVANNRQIAPSQPLHLADEVVDRALASGQAALPLFEIYRVCPALFQAPISPEDGRTVPIPPHKIASLLPARGASLPASATPSSPFSIASPATAPGFAGGTPSNSLFSPFVQADLPPGESSEPPTTLFHPSPFGFGSPAPLSSPFGLANASPEEGSGGLAPGVPNPFAPSSAVTFSSMAFGAPAPAPVPAPAPAPLAGSSPFSFGAPAVVPPAHTVAPAQAPASELSQAPSPFAAALPDAARPAPFDFSTQAKAPPPSTGAASPFAPAPAPAPQPSSSPLWAGGSPFAPSPAAPPPPAFAPESSPVVPPAQTMSPFNAPAGSPPSASALSPDAPEVPSWMQTPAKPGMGASPFAGFAVPPPPPPSPLAPLPPQDSSAVPSEFALPTPPPPAVSPPGAAEYPGSSAGMPAFPGFSSAPAGAPVQSSPPPAETPWQRPAAATPFQPSPAASGHAEQPQPPPLQPGPFSPAPEVSRPNHPPAGMNPFERIQALSRAETAAAPAPPPEGPASPPATGPIAESPGSAAPLAGFASPSAPFSASMPPVAAPPSSGEPAPAFAPPVAPAPSPVFAPAPEIHPAPHSSMPAGEKVTLSLAAVLKGCKTQDIGMSPDHIPSWVRVHLPLDLIRPQLLSGKVTLRVTQVMAALEPELRNLITPSRPDLSVDVPLSDLRKALPNEPFAEPASPAPEAAPQAPAFQMFSPSPAAMERSQAPDLVFGTPATTPPVSPFFQAVPPPAEIGAPSASDSAWPLQPGVPEPEPAPVAEPAALASAFSFLKDEPEVSAVSSQEDTVIDIPPATEDPAPSAAVPERPVPQLLPEPTGITKSSIRVIGPAPAGHSVSQMVLRALLNTDEPLDAPAVTQHMACLPGVVAVVCLRDGTCLASAGNGSAEAEHFLNQAPKLHHHVQPLIELTGTQDTETFSMNSGPLVITFSLQSELTLGVLHDPRTQGPALRERIILIARELIPLLDTPAA